MHRYYLLITLFCSLFMTGISLAAPPNGVQEYGGLELTSRIGDWAADGKRGGALHIAGSAKPAFAQDAILVAPQGSCSFLIRLDKKLPAGGTLFAVGELELVQLTDAPYLEFRAGSRAVRKTNYDWLPGDWHHVILSWDHGTPSLYVDGKPGSAPAAVDKWIAYQNDVMLGSGAGAVSFDEIFTSPLTITPDGAQRLAQIALSGTMVMSAPTLSINKTATPPTLDGVIAPGEWERAAGFANVIRLSSSVLPARQTWAWLTYDATNLYVALKTPVSDSITAHITKRDGEVFFDDSIEMFFMPNPSGALEYYQMIINAIGTQFDGKVTDVTWNGKWQVKSQVDAEWWTSEVVIPLADINARIPKDGDRWKMNICPSPAQWSQTGGTYHNSSQFGILKFREDRPVVRIGAIAKDGDTLRIPYTVIGTPRQELVLRADVYQASGIRPQATVRTRITPETLTGELVLQPVDFPQGMVEVLAFDDPSDPIYAQIIRFDAESFKTVVPLKAQSVAKPLFRPKPEATPPPVKTDPIVFEKEYRPSLDTIEEKIIEQQKWLGNAIGKSDRVPKPWTPMSVTGDTISCWAKAFRFARGAGLPQQVKILDADEFAGPVEFVSGTKVGGKRTLFIKETRDEKVTMVGRHDLGEVGVTMETTLEFDGFAKVEVTLSPNRPGAELDGLTLKLPFKKERAVYYSWWETCSYARPAWEVGNFITGKMRSGFEASVWIGDDDRGFCWFAEAPQNWSHPDDKDIIEIVPGAKSTDLLIHFLKGKQTLNKPLKLVFGYMATPAKPRPADWRTWEGTIYQIWDWFTVFSSGYPPVDIERFRQQVKNPRALPMLSCFFAGTCFMKDGYPTAEQWLWNPLWTTGWDGPRRPHGPYLNGNPKDGYISYGAMTMASSWPDYYMYKLKEMRESYGLRSVYLDTCIAEVNNPFAGMTWTDQQGKVRGKVDLFAFREAAKRIYNYIHEDPEGHVQMHHSNQVAIPILSFMDTHMNGEHFNTGPHQVGGRNYSDAMPVGTMRACYTLRQWGVVPNMLPEWPASTRGMMGYFWVHDGGLNGAWCDFEVFGKAVAAKKSFGLVDVDFLSYWSARAPAAPQPKDLYISAYEKTDKSAVMLIIANMQKSDAEVKVTLNESSLGWPLKGRTINAVDIEFGATFQIRDGQFTLPVKTQDFRMIKLMK